MSGQNLCRARLAGMVSYITWSVFIVLVLAACQESAPPPDNLIGYWTTSAPGYEDRYLKITESSIIFGTGPTTGYAQPIREIDVTEDGPRKLYTIVYGAQRGEEQSLSFYYDSDQQVITFRNQSHLLWKKTRAS